VDRKILGSARVGRVTLYSGKVDLGTGVSTASIQIVAAGRPRRGRYSDTSLTPAQGKTWGSLSIKVGGMRIRQATATARQALLQEAGTKLGTPVGDLIVRTE